jgi:hypothetical protein
MKKLIFLSFILFSNILLACDCPQLEPISNDLCKKYDVIFYGTVDSVIPCRTEGIGTVYFTVTSLYKGGVEQHVSVDYDCTSACLMSFSKNEEWIIYAVFQHFDLVTVDLCSHSRKKISDGSADYYQVASQRTFEQENEFLKATLGTQPYAAHNQINDKQKEMGPHNEQPSAMGKLWLLIVSLGAMIIVYIVSKKYFKNDK